MKFTIAILAFALAAFGQTTPPPAPATTVTISVPLPAGILAFGSFNQLGTPRFTGGFAAIYPVIGSIGIYGTTTTDILPRKTFDPATGRNYYAISTSVRQGFHKSLISTGAFTFLLGADVGPSFSESTAAAITGKTTIAVSLSTSATATAIYQISPLFSFAVPVRMLYESGIGWNPVVEAGFIINLQKLPPKK
jgi:hypothetical protein